MSKQFRVVVIGGGVLGSACAISLARRLGEGQVALLEGRVVGSGLSARHSGIVRAVNRSRTAVRMARQAADMWRQLQIHWGVSLVCQTPGVLWITPDRASGSWEMIAQNLKLEGVVFDRLSQQEAAAVCRQAISTSPRETYFYEPQGMLLEISEILTALPQALAKNSVMVFEHCPVKEIARNDKGEIHTLHTEHGDFKCEQAINAAGAWSAQLFARCGLTIPVALEPVLAANFLTGYNEIPESLPIIADQVQGFYIRRWPGGQRHVHRPRSRDAGEIRARFTLSALAFEGAEQIYSAANLSSSPELLTHYQTYLRNRLQQPVNPVLLTAFRSFFDISPDLNFILGQDPRARNLFHCLGAGQALKYAPVFGEIIASLVQGEDPGYDLQEFSIQRFFGRAPLDIRFPTQLGHF